MGSLLHGIDFASQFVGQKLAYCTTARQGLCFLLLYLSIVSERSILEKRKPRRFIENGSNATPRKRFPIVALHLFLFLRQKVYFLGLLAHFNSSNFKIFRDKCI